MADQPMRDPSRKVAQKTDAAARERAYQQKRRWRRENPERYRDTERERKRRARARAAGRASGQDQLRLET